MMEGLNKGFRYTPEEFKEKVAEFVNKGMSEEDARKEVLAAELVAQEKQKMAQKEKTKDTRYDLGDKKDWAA